MSPIFGVKSTVIIRSVSANVLAYNNAMLFAPVKSFIVYTPSENDTREK
jgi:hypothetical protein